ncbi:hypothetical protein [uncultured Lutibacter sp.]|uniref:hypothetical protein n=1 Tax=uncultured Lutibacter sp. TaxID=437739 RepID=UPI00260CD40F|nr:hypothetical protein [uncultured Lutibacter sp.]
MKFNSFNLIIIYTIFAQTSVFSQEKKIEQEHTTLPISIYTTIENSSSFNTISSFNNSSDLSIYRFASFNYHLLKKGYFSIPFKKLKKSNDYVTETYKNIYNKRNLEKSFFDVSKLYLPYIPKKY